MGVLRRGEIWAGESDPELAQPVEGRMIIEKIPDLPTTATVQQRLEEKVSKIAMKDLPHLRTYISFWSAWRASSPRAAL